MESANNLTVGKNCSGLFSSRTFCNRQSVRALLIETKRIYAVNDDFSC